MAALALTLLVEAVQQHRNRPAQMRDNEFDVRIAVRDLFGDHMQDERRILERSPDRGAKTILGYER